MSESTAVLVRDHLPTGLEVADLGERQLRGLDRPLHIWAVRGAGLGGDGELESVTAPISPSHDRVVGREGELATLQSAVDAARGGRPNIVLVVGEAGIGKTRLADEAANRARAAGMGVLHGEADPTIREPMELWRRVYRSLGVDPANDPAIPAADRRWEHLDSLAGALRSSAPAIVVLDDLHWADATAVWVLEQLPRALGDAPVVLVATSRDGEPDMPKLDALRRVCRVVRLEGLDADAVHQLAAAQASRPIDAVALTARTGGNPLFVRELLYAPDSGGVVGDVLDHSLQQLDADTRRLLGAAAVAGGGTPLWVLAAALGTTSGAAADRLAPAVRAGVLAEVGPTGVRFRHALWAEAAERHADGRDVHAGLAAAWEAVGGLEARAAATGHRVHAAADGEQLVTAVNSAIEVAAELVGADEQARAVALLRAARDAAVGCADLAQLRARVSADLADVLGWLGDFDLARTCFEEAAELSRRGADALLTARAEIGIAMWANPFLPDPSRLRRLEQALAALPAEELRLRAALLGRLAVVAGPQLDADHRARAFADDAVDAARRTGDPLLIVQALLDRYISPTTREELDARLIVADEVIALAERAGRGDLALQGHQWRFSHHLNRGDVAAAGRALGRAELLAELLPSPGWRHSTMVRRTTLLALAGSRRAATVSMTEALLVGAGSIEELALLGFELGHRVMLVELFGGHDPRLDDLFGRFLDLAPGVTVPFLDVHKGLVAHAVGDEARVDEMVQRYGPEPERVRDSLFGEYLLRVLADIVARSGATSMVGPVYATLLPYAGLLNAGGGLNAGLPVDDVLGRLAALAGDVRAAVRHATDAVALARAMPSPPMLVHCLDHLGDALAVLGDDAADAHWNEAAALAATVGVERSGRVPAPTARDDGGRAATMRRDATGWEVTSPIGAAKLPDSTGLGQLARLLSTPGVEVPAIELAGGPGAPVAADLGPALDAQAKRAYRQRLLELQAEVDDAAAGNDPVRAERAHVEIDALLRELERAVGLGGRDRPSGSGAERARVNVVRSLRRAITAVKHQAPDLGAHLEVSVRTGRYCAYVPEPAAALRWVVEA